jgi:hypothetical protein
MSWLRQKLFDWGLRFVLEKIPGVKDLDGKKRLIGNFLVYLGVVADAIGTLLHQACVNFGSQFAQACTLDVSWAAIAGQIVAFVGLGLKFVGDLHGADKDLRGV